MIFIKIIIGFIATVMSIIIGFIVLAVVAKGVDLLGKTLNKRKIHKVLELAGKVIKVLWNLFLVLISTLVVIALLYDFGDTIINWLN